MEWEVVWDQLSALYTEVIEYVNQHYPDIHAGTSRSASAGRRFAGQALFMYDPATQEHEDLILDLQCGPSDSGFYRSDGTVFAGRHPSDAIGFEIQRGSGESLALLDPILLPDDETAAAHNDAVTAYMTSVDLFVRRHMSLILSALNPAAAHANEHGDE